MGNKCIDIDECRQGLHRCEQTCVNELGAYRCECDRQAGYRLADDGLSCRVESCEDGWEHDDQGKCVDVDECRWLADIGNGRCVNFEGGYRIICDAGFERQGGEDECRDVDECRSEANQCRHICANYVGGFQCLCEEGYLLSRNGFDCELPEPSVTECGVGLRSVGAECVDVDECLDFIQEYGKCTNEYSTFQNVCFVSGILRESVGNGFRMNNNSDGIL